MEKTNKNNGNTVYNTIKTVSCLLFPLITFPYISRVILAENVGKINFGSSIVSYVSLLASLGVSTYAVRECSKVKENRDELGNTASQILSVNILSTLFAYLALAVVLIVARPLDNYRELICIQSSVVLFTTLGADWLNTAMEDYKYIAVRTICFQIISIVLMIIFVRRPEDYLVYAAISVLASSGAGIVNIFYRRRFCTTRFTLKIDFRKHLPPILMLFSLIVSQTIYTNSDITMLGLMKGDFEVGLYSTSVKIYNLINTVVASVMWAVMPKLASAFAADDYKEINQNLKYSLNFIIVIGLPCLAVINVIAGPIILTVAGEEFAGASTSLHILSAALLFSFISGWIGNITMLPAGKEKICLRSSIISAAANVLLNVFLIPRWGLNAAAFTTVIAELAGIVTKVPYMDKHIKIDGLWGMIKAPLIGSAAIAVIGVIFGNVFSSPYAITFSTMGAGCLAYMALLLLFRNEFFMGFAEPVIQRIKHGRKQSK